MAYQALYRKYRPRKFSEVIGQEHITTVLKNQVTEGHVSHAYLFCGSRGTGKTSTAKILSRAVNCLSPEDGEPCGKCEACLLSMGENTDIIELDAASNNGVDDMRALLDKAHFAPLHLGTKVYIIDEVHMLSTSAFNALLKTLEEPPKHLVFILATTEPRKLPATIVSRCQRFDFHRLSVKDIVSCLSGALEKSGATIDAEGLNAIARAADGGMRDALSLADQCLSFCGNRLTAQDVYSVLGSMEQDFLYDLAQALIDSDAGSALKLVDRVIAAGRDVGILMNDLSSHFRALLLAEACGSCADMLDCTDDAMQRYLAQAKSCSRARMLRALTTLSEAQNQLRFLPQPRILLESVLVRIAQPEQEQTIEALLDRVERLERQLKEGVRVVQAAAPAAAVPAAPQREERDLPPWEEAVPDDTPPWDDIPFPEPPPEEEESIPQEPAPRPKAAAPIPKGAPVAPVLEKASDAGDTSADGIWKRFLAALQKENLPLFVM
ncbi:MAG: DNA polymerase III subunit gamma/tau, partial [Clostridia bacterium]|nr:DNA polymerase III subunit gamma/tau [Clostridia bacterium]